MSENTVITNYVGGVGLLLFTGDDVSHVAAWLGPRNQDVVAIARGYLLEAALRAGDPLPQHGFGFLTSAWDAYCVLASPYLRCKSAEDCADQDDLLDDAVERYAPVRLTV